MIPEDYKDDIISSGITFMNAITRAYGAEEGMKLYDQIISSVDSDIKGKIFFALITGDHGGTIRLKGHEHVISTKIERIKAVRQVSNLSLKDAKELVEAVERGEPKSIPHLRSLMDRSDALSTLRRAGFVI
jgi:flavodoxin